MVIPTVEIGIIAFIINYLLSFFWNTRAMELFFGFMIFLLLFATANWFHLPVLKQLMLNVMNVLVLAVFIVFQPEIRMALSKLWNVKPKQFQIRIDLENFLDKIIKSAYFFSKKKIGALMVIENQDSLDEYSNKAVGLNAKLSSEILESIFSPSTPLHDGAVIVRGNIIVAAAVILPLSDDLPNLDKTIGTRHRAALGISQVSDAVIIVVSEENGRVSIIREGMMTQGVREEKLRGVLRSIFNSELKTNKKFHLWGKIKR